MDPNFKIIADLFQMPAPPDLDETESVPRKKRGDTAEECDELGEMCLNEGDYEGAIAHFRRAVEMRAPDDITSRINLAGALDFGDRAPAAYRQYEIARRAQEAAPEPMVGLSDLLKRYGRFREAAEELQAAIDKEPENHFYWFKLAELFRQMGERKRAHATAQGAIALKPDESFYHYWLGDLQIDMGLDAEALASLRAAIELSPGDDYLYLRTVVPFWRQGRKEEAIKALRLASDLDPAKNLYHGVLEELLIRLDRLDEAELEKERATQMDSFDEDALDRLLAEMGLQ